MPKNVKFACKTILFDTIITCICTILDKDNCSCFQKVKITAIKILNLYFPQEIIENNFLKCR